MKFFQFVYAGPLKALVTSPLFAVFGFNILTVRLFSIGVFISGVVILSVWLARNRQYVASVSFAVMAFANADLLFFARTDINQATFHNTITLLLFIGFLQIIRSGAGRWRSVFFLVLCLVEMNNHIRNIWIINAMVVAVFADGWFANGRRLRWPDIKKMTGTYWPVFAGWLISASYFFFLLLYFRNNHMLKDAGALGSEFGWPDRIRIATGNFLSYCTGGMVFRTAYGSSVWQWLIPIAGLVIVFFLILFFRRTWKEIGRPDGTYRFLRISSVMVICVLAQYILTRSAVHPWHGNSLILFTVIFSGFLAQTLYEKKGLPTAVLFTGILVTIQCLVAVSAFRQIPVPARPLNRFSMAAWDLPALDSVRQFIHSRKAVYHIADWGIGRPLALEARYSPIPGTRVILEERPMTPNMAQQLKNCVVIRSTPVALTTPNYTDKFLRKYGDRITFQPIRSFYDRFGREVYQAGYILTPD